MDLLKLILKFLKDLREFRKKKDPEPMPEPDAEDQGVPTPEPEEPAVPGKGSQILLWKPVSESTGAAVVLLPSWLRPSMVRMFLVNNKLDIHTKSSKALMEPDDKIWPNDDRIHIYLNKKGRAYGKKVILALVRSNGKRNTLSIGDGSKRFQLHWGT